MVVRCSPHVKSKFPKYESCQLPSKWLRRGAPGWCHSTWSLGSTCLGIVADWPLATAKWLTMINLVSRSLFIFLGSQKESRSMIESSWKHSQAVLLLGILAICFWVDEAWLQGALLSRILSASSCPVLSFSTRLFAVPSIHHPQRPWACSSWNHHRETCREKRMCRHAKELRVIGSGAPFSVSAAGKVVLVHHVALLNLRCF